MSENSCCVGPGDSVTTDDFNRAVSKVKGNCKIGEEWSIAASHNGKIPVLSCEGPCAKGEIARRTATLIPKLDDRFERACHGEAFYVPHSTMAKWVADARQVVMVDGCFLNCHGRVLENIIPGERITQINAHAIHKKYGDTFSCDGIRKEEFAALATMVAEETIAVTLGKIT